MNNKRFSIVLGVISTLIFLALLPYLIRDFFKEGTGIWTRLNYFAIPLFVAFMWRQIVKLLKEGDVRNSDEPENDNANG